MFALWYWKCPGFEAQRFISKEAGVPYCSCEIMLLCLQCTCTLDPPIGQRVVV